MRGKILKTTIVWIAFIMILLLVLQYLMQIKNKRNNSFQSAELLLDQLEESLKNNKNEERIRIQEIKNDYIVRARTISYIIEKNPEYENDIKELRLLASLVEVDEIHFFDVDGAICSGTNPEYYGVTMDDGVQIGFFKSMLYDRNISLCQDITQNTAEGKPMMYAMVWKTDGTGLVQVGVEPTRLMEQIEENNLENFMERVPTLNDITLFAVDRLSGEILGSTDKNQNGKQIDKFGIDTEQINANKRLTGKSSDGTDKYYYVFRQYGDYCIGALQKVKSANALIRDDMIVLSISVIVAAVAIIIFARVANSLIVNNEAKYHKAEEKSRIGMYEAQMNNAMRKSIDHAKPKDAIKEILMTVGDVIHSDRGIVYISDNDVLMTESMSWVREDCVDKFVVPQIRNEAIHVWEKRFNEGKNIIFYTAKQVLEEYGDHTDYKFMQEYGLENTVIIPLYTKGVMIGIMGFGNVDETIIADVETMLVQIANFTISLLRQDVTHRRLTFLSYNDELTGALNRHALDQRVDDMPHGTALSVIFGDVMGLKQINDTAGHSAGDNLLIKAYNTCKEEFGEENVYRIGGDEYVILMENCTVEETVDRMKALSDSLVNANSEMALGYAFTDDFNGNYKELQRVADERMYNDKKHRYMKTSGKRRRVKKVVNIVQGEMLAALSDSYVKVLRVNLSFDSFEVVKVSDEEKNESLAYSDSFEVWVSNFVKMGYVAEEDKEVFSSKMTLEYLKSYFEQGNDRFAFEYRRKQGDKFCKAIAEIVPAPDYSSDYQSVYLFVKDISRS